MPNGEKYMGEQGISEEEQKRRAFTLDAEQAFFPPVPQPTYDLPDVECASFGAYERDAQYALDVAHRFLTLPVIPYRFSTHHEWSAWKVRMRNTYGQEFANEQLKTFEHNKLRSNSLSALALAAENLVMACERGDERDRAFAAQVDRIIKPNELIQSIQAYRTLPVAEGVSAMAFFDQRALELIEVIRHEAEARAFAFSPSRHVQREETLFAK